MFSFLVNIFNAVLYRPLFNLLVLFYNFIPQHDFGIAIILLTLIIRIILYPVSSKALHSQLALQKLQPKLQEIQKQYKDDKEKQARETLELYKKEKVNPFGGILLALIQLPILIALYSVFWNGLKAEELNNLYGFISNPSVIDPMFLGLVNLSKPNIIFAFLAGITQFFQTKMLAPKLLKGGAAKNDMAQMMQKQMVYFFPVITVIILFNLPSALGLYWITSSLLSIGHQYLLLKKQKNN